LELAGVSLNSPGFLSNEWGPPHTLLDLRGNIPSFIHISDGQMHDMRVLDMLELELVRFT
jgi:hypothetical protein